VFRRNTPPGRVAQQSVATRLLVNAHTPATSPAVSGRRMRTLAPFRGHSWPLLGISCLQEIPKEAGVPKEHPPSCDAPPAHRGGGQEGARLGVCQRHIPSRQVWGAPLRFVSQIAGAPPQRRRLALPGLQRRHLGVPRSAFGRALEGRQNEDNNGNIFFILKMGQKTSPILLRLGVGQT
jgi:hypothetical protein